MGGGWKVGPCSHLCGPLQRPATPQEAPWRWPSSSLLFPAHISHGNLSGKLPRQPDKSIFGPCAACVRVNLLTLFWRPALARSKRLRFEGLPTLAAAGASSGRTFQPEMVHRLAVDASRSSCAVSFLFTPYLNIQVSTWTKWFRNGQWHIVLVAMAPIARSCAPTRKLPIASHVVMASRQPSKFDPR